MKSFADPKSGLALALLIVTMLPKVLIGVEGSAWSGAFQTAGWQVVGECATCDSPRLAGEVAPDLVVVPLGEEGVAALQELQAQRQTRHMKVATVGAEGSGEERARSAAEGAFVCLAAPLKPASLEALKRLVPVDPQAPRVLISDDDDLLVRSLERAARYEGLEPVSETDSAHVVGRARELKPEVIVLDINQKSLDGRDVLAQLKKDPQTRDIRVVMLSAVEDQFVRHDCLVMGADDYVVKPVDPLFFVRIARRLAEQRVS